MAEIDFNCWDCEGAVAQIANELSLKVHQVGAAIQLLEDGNTLPFIARYRKEATGQLDEIELRAIEDLSQSLRELAQRKETVLRTIHEQGLLTGELKQSILDCSEKSALEELYLPYKPKRRTRATVARERGLQPLADLLMTQDTLNRSRKDIVSPFIDASKDVPDYETAVAGACDIVAEAWSESIGNRRFMDEQTAYARMKSAVKRGKREEAEKYEAFFDYSEKLERVPSHRMLAMRRGENEGLLRLGLEVNDEVVLRKFKARNVVNHAFEFRSELLETAEDCYQRLLRPAWESKVLQAGKEVADTEAIKVFAQNLRALLLAAPAGPQVTIGIDPGFRTGCKVAVVDGTGKFLKSATIFPTPPKNDTASAGETLLRLTEECNPKLIAIGNGTASRETDRFVSSWLKQHSLDITKVIVNESGASIYSASELAAKEYPDLDVTVRGAISIAHRLQDPLAELVKIDPKSIGVGQYQHDVNQTSLKKSLDREVESCVNSVGVDVNLASPALLGYVAGLGPKLAGNIVQFRNENGEFERREQLLSVPKLGKRAFEQAAGFLRIRNGANPLDNSSVHPESYPVVEAMAAQLSVPVSGLVGSESLAGKVDVGRLIAGGAGEATVQDILQEIAKPGRDPRKQFKAARLADDVNEIEDLKAGQILEGTVTNVTRFGAFVDLGVHQDGLIHISELDNTFVNDPADVVSAGDIVRVKVLEVDMQRKRISLSRKQLL